MMDESVFEPERDTSWCPGCGNFPLRKALVSALADLDLTPDNVAMFSGIGQAAKMPHYLKVNGFNGLHGRALPPAVGFRLANPEMTVIVQSGDGDTYGEGGNHLLHNIRRNPDIAHFVHNNQIYGLTKGQASPTTGCEIKTKVQPRGVNAEPFNPLEFAVGMNASFVARGFVGEREHLEKLMKKAIQHRGYALLDILQPCVSFNRVNTYQWYSERTYILEEEYDPADRDEAFSRAREWGEKIPLGIIFRREKEVFRDNYPHLPESLRVNIAPPEDKKSIIEKFK